MFKNPIVQAFVAFLVGFLLLGPLGAVLGFIAWLMIYTSNKK